MNNSQNLIIEGANMTGIGSFYDEINRVFMHDESWTLGPSLDALNDMLYGDYGTLAGAQTAVIEWRDIAATRSALGIEATLSFLEERRLSRPEFNGRPIVDQIAALRAGRGITYFDVVMEIFAEHDNLTIAAA